MLVVRHVRMPLAGWKSELRIAVLSDLHVGSPHVGLDKVRTILIQLDEALTIEDMSMTSFHLHPLKGDRKGFWSVTVRANWRIVFRFEDGAANAVDLIDYH